MQTLTEVANERTSTIIFPMPIDLVEKITDPIKATLNEAAIKKAMKADEWLAQMKSNKKGSTVVEP